MSPDLRGENLTKRARGLTLLSDVNFHWKCGNIIGLSGPNGAGKTTLLNVISGFVKPDAGRCLLGSTVLTSMSPWRVAGAGISRTFQSVRLVPSLTALQQAALALAFAGKGRISERVTRMWRRPQQMVEAERVLDRVGFSARRDEPLVSLTLGQMKQVSLACCLAADAPTLLLDEPLAGMDHGAASVVFELLGSLRDEGRLIVLIEHSDAILRSLADVAVHMVQGRIISERRAS